MDEKRVRVPADVGQERRGSTRYSLNLEVRYAILNGAPVETGLGRTIDLSTSGLSFTADKPLSIGQRLNLSIDWPALLSGGVELQLMVSGSVIRTSGMAVALKVERYEFKTRRKRSENRLA